MSYCSPSRLSNGNCDIICNISLCQYDGGDCLCPVKQCPPSSRGNGVCDRRCASAGCKYDNGDCCNTELCTLSMRNNSRCDQPCNNKACNFDGGECSSNAASSVDSSKFNAKFRPVSVLESRKDSPVLQAIHKHALQVIADHDARTSSETRYSRHLHQSQSASPVPTAVLCSKSAFSLKSSFIDSGTEASTVQSSDCSGISPCSSCGVCGVCRDSGCDTSFFDSFCQSKGPTWACAAVQPLPSNNYSVFGCINTSAASNASLPSPVVALSGSVGSEPTALSPGAIAGIAIAALFVAALLLAAAFFVHRHRGTAAAAPANLVVQVQMQNMGPDHREPNADDHLL